jgi:hypothetical protein
MKPATPVEYSNDLTRRIRRLREMASLERATGGRMRDNSISSPAFHKAMTAPRLNRREVLAGGIAFGALTLSGLQIVEGALLGV